MSEALWLGAILAIAGGAMQGAFGAPMKYARKWQHENIWLVFALSGLVVLPWILTISTIPNCFEIYRSSPAELLFVTVACGVGWGIGATLVGITFRMLGIGLAFAIILGLSSLFGSLIPFLYQTRQNIVSSQGLLYLVSTVIMLTGVAIVSVAGAIRDRTSASADVEARTGRRFATGLMIAIAAGVLSSLLSDAIAFTHPLVSVALQRGTKLVWASNIVLALATTGGALVNVVYCLYKMRSNQSGTLFFAQGTSSHWIFGILMGAFWYGGLLLYGFAERRIGTVTGWPLFIGAMILSSSAVGFLTGEWSGTGRRSKIYLCFGSLIIFLALIVTGMAQNG